MERAHYHLRLLRRRVFPHQLPIEQRLRGCTSRILSAGAFVGRRDVKSRPLSRVVLCGLFLLALSIVARAAENPVAPKPLDIEVQAAGFGKVSAADITAVLESAASEIWRYCAHAQLPGIDMYPSSDHPQTNFEREPNGRVAIGLTARNTSWAQYRLSVCTRVLPHAGELR